jgi:lactoylglutathione lyase
MVIVIPKRQGETDMKICWCTVTVSDMDESIRFYEDIVGLKLERRFPAGPGGEIAFMGGGETKLELIGGAKPIIGDDISLGFEVDSLAEKMAFVAEKGVRIHSGPFEPNPHLRFFFVKDPSGLKIQFVENRQI